MKVARVKTVFPVRTADLVSQVSEESQVYEVKRENKETLSR